MPIASLTGNIRLLEDDLRSTPPAFVLYRDLPLALFQYRPEHEWELRTELRRLTTRLQPVKHVVDVSLADLLWRAIEQAEGLEALASYERTEGFEAAQRQVNLYLSRAEWSPLAEMVAAEFKSLDPSKDVVFITRTAALAPDAYPISSLMESLYEHRLETPGVLFYPGTVDPNSDGLRFMDLPGRSTTGSYRIKRYTY